MQSEPPIPYFALALDIEHRRLEVTERIAWAMASCGVELGAIVTYHMPGSFGRTVIHDASHSVAAEVVIEHEVLSPDFKLVVRVRPDIEAAWTSTLAPVRTVAAR